MVSNWFIWAVSEPVRCCWQDCSSMIYSGCLKLMLWWPLPRTLKLRLNVLLTQNHRHEKTKKLYNKTWGNLGDFQKLLLGFFLLAEKNKTLNQLRATWRWFEIFLNIYRSKIRCKTCIPNCSDVSARSLGKRIGCEQLRYVGAWWYRNSWYIYCVVVAIWLQVK